jgi:hypothetical protein
MPMPLFSWTFLTAHFKTKSKSNTDKTPPYFRPFVPEIHKKMFTWHSPQQHLQAMFFS